MRSLTSQLLGSFIKCRKTVLGIFILTNLYDKNALMTIAIYPMNSISSWFRRINHEKYPGYPLTFRCRTPKRAVG